MIQITRTAEELRMSFGNGLGLDSSQPSHKDSKLHIPVPIDVFGKYELAAGLT